MYAGTVTGGVAESEKLLAIPHLQGSLMVALASINKLFQFAHLKMAIPGVSYGGYPVCAILNIGVLHTSVHSYHIMQLEYTKVTLAAIWGVAICGAGVAANLTSIPAWGILGSL